MTKTLKRISEVAASIALFVAFATSKWVRKESHFELTGIVVLMLCVGAGITMSQVIMLDEDRKHRLAWGITGACLGFSTFVVVMYLTARTAIGVV